ncbi:39S ribosomal protein L47, mitochondrial [Teleopsis dalmanni]|uniref:39S ribosomal protein L47, mitochondrial n=1 Tax=Teleopsis dalmanni TaxID=139649 RepID=UPI0018CEF074|nr:39S ribosomal protein L47, mitochondrial [Teleopsis dalmanni]
MSNIFKCLNIAKNITTLCQSVAIKAAQSNTQLLSAARHVLPSVVTGTNSVRSLHSTNVRYDLMEFFDDPKNWPENEVKVGRAWKLDELRIKSNKELHQLWYILLKERNMLLTMEHECNDKMELFPSPERVDKVKISMNNLETVVRERNTAYHLLETGETGERPKRLVSNIIGMRSMYKSSEHAIPSHMNKKWFKTRSFSYGGHAVRKFLLLFREKLYNEKRKARVRSRNNVMMLLRRYPDLDLNMLRNKYPDADIDKLIRDDKIRGHFVPKF